MEFDEKKSTGDDGKKWGVVSGVHFAPDENLSGDMTIGDAIATEAGQEQIRRIEEANDRARENMRRGNGGDYAVDDGSSVFTFKLEPFGALEPNKVDDGSAPMSENLAMDAPSVTVEYRGEAEVDFGNIEEVEKAAEKLFDTLSVNEQGALVISVCKEITGEDFSAIRKESEERQNEVRELIRKDIDRREASGELDEWLEGWRARNRELSIPKESEERLQEIEVREVENRERQARIESLENSMKGARGSFNRALDAAETFEQVESIDPERIEHKEMGRRIYIGHLESIVRSGAEGGAIDRDTAKFYLAKAGKNVDEIQKRDDDDPEKQMIEGKIDEEALRKVMQEGGVERKEIELEMAERGVRIAEAGIAAVKLRREELNGNTADGASRIAKKAAAPFKFMKRDEIELELRKADSKLQEAKRELEEKKKFYKSLEWDALSPEEKEAQLQAKWKKEEHARELAREREEYFRRKRVEERRAREEAAREEAERAAREAASQEASRESSQESEAQEVPAPKRRRGVPKRGTGAHARR